MYVEGGTLRGVRWGRGESGTSTREGGDDTTKNIFLATKNIFHIKAETTRPKISSSRLRRRRCYFSDQGGDGATFQTNTETARLRIIPLQPKRRRQNFPDQGGVGATFKKKMKRARLSRQRPWCLTTTFDGHVGNKVNVERETKTENDHLPSRDFSPRLKQDLSGLSGFFRQLRSKSCFKMSDLSGF